MLPLTLDIIQALNSSVPVEYYYPDLQATRDLFSIMSHKGVAIYLKGFWELGLPANWCAQIIMPCPVFGFITINDITNNLTYINFSFDALNEYLSCMSDYNHYKLTNYLNIYFEKYPGTDWTPDTLKAPDAIQKVESILRYRQNLLLGHRSQIVQIAYMTNPNPFNTSHP
jgi:hypothetical protein